MKQFAKRWLCSLLVCVLILGSLPVLVLAQEADETDYEETLEEVSSDYLAAPASSVIDSGTCGEQGDNLTWVLTDDGVLTISGRGEMADYYDYKDSVVSPWYSHRTKITSVVIEDGVTSLGSYAFYACYKLTSVSIPDGITSIGYSAFQNCSRLTSVSIPEGVTSIGDSAFTGCSSLASVSIPDSVTSIRSSAFSGCSSLTSVSIPEGVTSIGSGAFEDCSSLTSVSIPDSVSYIGDSAFRNCSSLTSVSIPDSVTSIGDSAFYGCSSLTSVSIPDEVTSIGSGAFSGCSSLASVSIPEGVTSIGGYAFRNCSSLTSVSIPVGVTYIASSTFDGCSSLTSVSIPDSVSSIGYYAFRNCSSLTSVSIPDGVTSIEWAAFDGCSSLTSVSIPEGVTSIEFSAFSGCSSLTSVSIPNSVTSIGDFAFGNCSSLTSVSIPEGVTSIGDSAFSGCSSLTSVSIPDSVSSIGKNAFYSCSNLTEVRFLGNGFMGSANIFSYPVTAYYPRGNTTWTEAIRDSFGSKVIWVEACTGGMAHTEVIDAAREPTCTETGLTEGKHCSVCKDVLVAQEVVSAKGHTPGGWEHNSTQHWHVCTICKNALDRAEHTYSDDTCTVCDYSKVTPFVDVPTNAYYFDAVQWAVENKITAGTSDITFSPDAPCTRAQAVSFLWRAAGRPTPTSSQMTFTDVAPDSYYRTAVLWAVENKITSGTSAATFSPDATCTRGQIVSFLCRAFGEPGSANTSFTDVPADAYYAGAVSWAVANGVTAGTGDGKFSPDADCTRGQIVSFLYRCRDKM